MSIYTLTDITKDLKESKEDAKACIEAWEKFKIVTKKNGEPFSIFSKNFEGASVGKYSIVEDSLHPYLTISYNYDHKYETDHKEIYYYLDELPDEDERKKAYERQFQRQTVTMNFEEKRKTIDNYIEELKCQYESYNKQIEIAEKVYNDYKQTVSEAKKKMFNDCGGEKNTLYYDVLETCK